jgi:hypothetical protein
MSNNKQQTAVQWGIEKLASLTFDYMAGFISKHEYNELSKGIIRQAKEMEKEQIIDAILDNKNITSQVIKDAEEWYNNRFGGGEK